MKKILIAISITLTSAASHGYCKAKKQIIVYGAGGRKATVLQEGNCFESRDNVRNWATDQIRTERTLSLIQAAACAPSEEQERKTFSVYYPAWPRDCDWGSCQLEHQLLGNVTVLCGSGNQATGTTLECPTSVQTVALNGTGGFIAQTEGRGQVTQNLVSANKFEGHLYCMYGTGANSYRVHKQLPANNCEIVRNKSAYCPPR